MECIYAILKAVVAVQEAIAKCKDVSVDGYYIDALRELREELEEILESEG